jgi:hypothetical protein
MESSDPDPPVYGVPHVEYSREPSPSAVVHRILEFERTLADRLATRVQTLVYADAGLRHRRIHTTMAQVASSVGPTLTSRGWSQDQWVYMSHDRRSSTVVAAHGYAVVDSATWAPAARTFLADQESGRAPVVITGMVAQDRRLARQRAWPHTARWCSA